MRIVDIKLFRFRLRLNEPLILKGTSFDFREGILVQVVDTDGYSGWGEIAPLSGFSAESPAQAESDVRRLRERLRESPVPEEISATTFGFDRWIGGEISSASARFGFETAVLKMIAVRKGQNLAELLGAPPAAVIPVNALLDGPKDMILSRARALRDSGYRAFKVKIGELTLDDTVSLITDIRAAIGPSARLRLDLNRRWGTEPSLALLARIESAAPEYVEEPGRNINQLRTIIKQKYRRVAVALDESLLEINPEDLSHVGGIKAIIIKPTLLGLERSRRFAIAAHEAGITTVISSSFESSVGIHALASLAAAINAPQAVPAGLDTLDRLAEDLIHPPLGIHHGRLTLPPDKVPAESLRWHLLEEIKND